MPTRPGSYSLDAWKDLTPSRVVLSSRTVIKSLLRTGDSGRRSPGRHGCNNGNETSPEAEEAATDTALAVR